MRAIYLSGPLVYLRALTREDKATASTWHPSPFPLSSTQAEEWLQEAHADNWNLQKPLYYLIVRTADDTPVGSAAIRMIGLRRAFLTFVLASWCDDADALRAAALELLIPWIANDLEQMTVTVPVAADQPATIAAAERLGLERNATLREMHARPGKRVDEYLYQILNTPWKVADA